MQPPAVDAEDRLAEALRQASDEDKRVLVHVGTPHCVWCKVLTKFLDEHKAILSPDYVDLRIDMRRMRHGKGLKARLMPKDSDGVPQMAILDASGKVLATSLGPGGNIGYPCQPVEIDHFIAMLADTRQRLADRDLQQIRPTWTCSATNTRSGRLRGGNRLQTTGFELQVRMGEVTAHLRKLGAGRPSRSSNLRH